MKFMLRKANDWEFNEEIEVNTIEELKYLSIQAGHELILDFDPIVSDIPQILIYNDDIE